MQFIKLMSKSEAEKTFDYHFDYISSTAAAQAIKLKGYTGSKFMTLQQTFNAMMNREHFKIEETERMMAGVKLEKGIIDMFAHKFKCLAVPSKYVYSSVDLPYMADNPDGFVMGKDGTIEAVIEVKNIALDQAHCWNNGVDEKYFWQGLHHSIFYGVPCVFAVLIGGNTLRRFFLDSTDFPTESKDLVEAERLLFDLVKSKTPPKLIEANDSKTFNAIVPSDNAVKELVFEDLDIENYLKAKEELALLTDFVKTREAQYKEVMQNNVKAYCMHELDKKTIVLYQFSYTPVKGIDKESIETAYAPELAAYRTEINWKKFEEDHPEIINASKKPMTRRFSIKKKEVGTKEIQKVIEKINKTVDEE